MADSLERTIRELADNRCEYCKVTQSSSRISFVLDHIIARQHGGQTLPANLALCCPRCNQSKGPNIAGIDPQSGLLTRLFHPRNEFWHTHFSYQSAILFGLTDVGRTTISVLAINLPIRVVVRQGLIEAKLISF